jgi:hypothetical protein
MLNCLRKKPDKEAFDAHFATAKLDKPILPYC